MKRSAAIGTMVSLLSFLVLLNACGSGPDAEKIHKWKMHTYVPESVSLYQGYMLPLIEALRKRTGGRIEITPYPVNAIVSSSDLLLATAEGAVECAMATPGYDTGIIEEVEAINSNTAEQLRMLREHLDRKGGDYPGRQLPRRIGGLG